MRLLRRTLLALLILGALALLWGTWMARRSFPIVDGSVRLPGLERDVTVGRDAAGVPHISADTLEDLFRAQGYVHAQDRFWQMDTWRHIGAGRLAEMFGDGQVETDAFLRTLGFERLAAEAYDAMPSRLRSGLEAYAEGVNAYLEERPGGAPLSLEYAALGLQNGDYRPEPWEPVHTLTWAHVMAWDLRNNLKEEIERTFVSGDVGEERVEDLFPPYPPGHPLIVETGSATARRGDARPWPGAEEALARAAGRIERVDSVLGEPFDGIGSNSWVVDGSRTASGLPLVANDPHLGIQ
ncbi:MAG: penicillin acylase family protein, partial [Actinomycetota bacterium]